MDVSRRSFLKRFGLVAPAVTTAIVAPTLAETLLVGAKKYFFMGGSDSWGEAFGTFSSRFGEAMAQFRANLDALTHPVSEADIIGLQLERVRMQLPTLFEREDAFYKVIEGARVKYGPSREPRTLLDTINDDLSIPDDPNDDEGERPASLIYDPDEDW